MLRMTLLVVAAAMLAGIAPAHADVTTYCNAYARDAADRHLSGAGLLGTEVATTVGEWEEVNRLALADCLSVYEDGGDIEPEVTPEVAEAAPVRKASPSKPKMELLARRSDKSTVGSKPSLVPGSQAWNDYCDRKYASFDRSTGTYKSNSGKRRRCTVTRN